MFQAGLSYGARQPSTRTLKLRAWVEVRVRLDVSLLSLGSLVSGVLMQTSGARLGLRSSKILLSGRLGWESAIPVGGQTFPKT